MRRHTPVTNRPGIGPVAVRDMFSGWEIIAFSRWYELTGEKSALEFATAEEIETASVKMSMMEPFVPTVPLE